jgi:hypothetical protein
MIICSSIPKACWLIVAALLIVATQRLRYDYYTALRVTVFVASLFLAFASFQTATPSHGVWLLGFLIVAMIFNPLVPIHFRRSTWAYIDLATACLFLAHLVLVRWRLDARGS